MKLLATPKDLAQIFLTLLDKYNAYYFATAWAGLPQNIFQKLVDNSSRIKQFVVGIHFYQTDPKFFKQFLENNYVRTILQPNGTFHPKLYLFYESDSEWTLLIGSGNFTNAAFSTNTEVMIELHSSEAPLTMLKEAKEIINRNWAKAKPIDIEFLNSYQLLWNKFHVKIKELTKSEGIQNILEKGTTTLMEESWTDYAARFSVYKDIVEKRFNMLESVRKIFARGRSLIEMTEDERRFISGNPTKLNVPGADISGHFGTSGNGKFMKKMIDGNIYISNALDKIPLSGEVTEHNFNEFLSIFLEEPDITKTWVSSAGRLLALKRPDTFYNITSANRKNFCENFGNIESHTKDLNNYWTLIVQKIQLCSWYNQPSTKNDFERKLRETRAAMLDVFFYEK